VKIAAFEGRHPVDPDRVPGADAPLIRLSDRQREVLALMAAGASNAAIGRKLSITERTVVQHCSNIYDLIGLRQSDDEHRRVLVVLWYLRYFAISPL
jgi:DNA-binding CsgD family transcriptional regulator